MLTLGNQTLHENSGAYTPMYFKTHINLLAAECLEQQLYMLGNPFATCEASIILCEGLAGTLAGIRASAVYS